MEKVAYTVAEFSALFGKEKTWGYRQLYAGNVEAISEFGTTMIPKSEADRLLKSKSRYLGANTGSKKAEKHEKKNPDEQAENSQPGASKRKSAWPKLPRSEDPTESRKAAFTRLTKKGDTE